MNDVDEIIIKGKRDRQPMSFERLQFICYFIAGVIAEVFGFILLLVIVLGMAGVFK